MAKRMAHVHLTHFEMEIKRHLMCVCGDSMKGKYPYSLSVHSLSFYLFLHFARSLTPSLDTHHLVFVVRKHIHTEQPASTNFTQNTRNYLFRHSNNPQSCNIQIERENRRGVEKKRVRKAINNGTKWIFMCCLLFKYTFSVLSVVASNVRCVYGRVMFSQRKTSRVRSEVWIQKKTSVIIIYAYNVHTQFYPISSSLSIPTNRFKRSKGVSMWVCVRSHTNTQFIVCSAENWIYRKKCD